MGCYRYVSKFLGGKESRSDEKRDVERRVFAQMSKS